jgi:hypothetical protein
MFTNQILFNQLDREMWYRTIVVLTEILYNFFVRT